MPFDDLIISQVPASQDLKSLPLQQRQDTMGAPRTAQVASGELSFHPAHCVDAAGAGQARPGGPARGAEPPPLPLLVASVLAPTEITRQNCGLVFEKQGFTPARCQQFTWRDIYWAEMHELAASKLEKRDYNANRIAELLGVNDGDIVPEPSTAVDGTPNLRRNCPDIRFTALVHSCGLDGKVLAEPCRKRRCAVCRGAWLQEMQNQYRPLIERLGKVTKLRFCTFTIVSMSLEAGLEQAKAAMARLQRTSFWKHSVVGALKRFEWTIKLIRGQEGLFHVHVHLLVAGRYMDQPMLKELWLRATKGLGEVVDIRMVYDDQHITGELVKWRKANPLGAGEPLSYAQTAGYLTKDIDLPPEGNEDLRDYIFGVLESQRLVEPLGLFRKSEYEKEALRTATDNVDRAELLAREVQRAEKNEKRLRRAAKLIAEQMESADGRDDYALRDKQIDTDWKIYMARELRSAVTWALKRRPQEMAVLLPVIREWLAEQQETEPVKVPCRHCGGTDGWRTVDDLFELRGLANSAYYHTTVHLRQIARSGGVVYDEAASARANEKASPAGEQAQTQGEPNQKGGPSSEAQTRWYQETIPFNAVG